MRDALPVFEQAWFRAVFCEIRTAFFFGQTGCEEINSAEPFVLAEGRGDALCPDRLNAGVQLGAAREIILVVCIDRRDDRFHFRLNRAGEDAMQRIVIGLRNRIELVIVAARARNGETEERFRGYVDAVVDHVIRIAVEMIAEREETERRQ